MGKSTNRQILDRWCARVWGERDEAAIHDLFAGDGSAGGLGREKLAGPDDFVEFHRAICRLMTDTHVEIDSVLEDGAKMFVLATFSGNCAKTGKPISIEGSMSFEFTDTQILHCANHFEFLDMFEQLGLLPVDTFASLLSQQKFAVVTEA